MGIDKIYSKNKAKELITNSKIHDPELFIEFLEKFIIQIKEKSKEDSLEDNNKIMVVPIKNLLRIIKHYNKNNLKLVNLQLLHNVLKKNVEV